MIERIEILLNGHRVASRTFSVYEGYTVPQLRKMMDKAVAFEKYEEAAAIRDEIQEREAKASN